MSRILTVEPRKRINGWNQVPYKANGEKPSGERLSVVLNDESEWPQDIIEAYDRTSGPYTAINAEEILSEEPVELYNGWLVRQEMTDFVERRAVANIQDMLSISARNMGFGQAIPDQMECLMNNGDVIKPDASLISTKRISAQVHPYGPNDRPMLFGGPELVIESRSPSNRRTQERRKRAQYFANNVQIIWDVDEEHETIWVYRARRPETPQKYGIGDEIDCEPLLPGWRRKVEDIFSDELLSAEAVVGEVAEEWRSEGRIEGLLEGIEQGREEGEAKALRKMLPRLAKSTYRQELPSDLPTRLASCKLTHLEKLEEAFETYATLDEWLKLLPK